jgi:CTP synthase
VFVTGGVVSSLGKGIASASIALLLKQRGLRVNVIKCDPYLNVDPGTMSPYQHGEVFVTDDGGETDLDLGHYERFLGGDLGKKNNVTTGQVYATILEKERRGDYLGGTVQVIPHVTEEIKARIRACADGDNPYDVVVVEVGGTVGDIEGQPFLEAIRQMRLDEGTDSTAYVHLTLVPYVQSAGEPKTKPTQHSVRELREMGIQPDVLLCRSDHVISDPLKRKISLFTSVSQEAVIEAKDVESIYEVPVVFREQGLDTVLAGILKLPRKEPDLDEWRSFVSRVHNPKHEVSITVVGKYTGLVDAYKSIAEAFIHAGVANDARVRLTWVDAEDIEENGNDTLAGCDGILIPGGFGRRGIEGKIAAAGYARENDIPFLGICLGMQVAVIEFARNACELTDADSYEFNQQTPHPVIHLMPDQHGVVEMGGTLRLGAYPCKLSRGSKAAKAYGAGEVFERHRHRYEFNNEYREIMTERGMRISGVSPDDRLVEIVELSDHPFFVAGQFHPELKSRPQRPAPLFREFIKAALRKSRSKKK